MAPALARKYPAIPASNEQQAVTISRTQTGRTRLAASNLGQDPTRQASTAEMLRIAPIHEVAMKAQAKASGVGSSVWKMGGRPMVKYLTQTLAVT